MFYMLKKRKTILLVYIYRTNIHFPINGVKLQKILRYNCKYSKKATT